ncbi:MAG: branched-chain amino acid ABC transporter permease [Proteobacteria bacterium]|nr:branched-chain amino acid ABC transporter permease [Pseudomonadota bacterium]
MLSINIFNGLVYGALLVVMSSGLALIYGLRRVVNFAHGSLYMLGAYLGYTVASHTNFWVAQVAVPLLMGLLGLALDRFAFRPLQDRDPLTVILVTFGLLLVIEDFVQTVWGKSNLSVPAPDLLNASVDLFGMSVPAYRIAVIFFGLVVAGALTLWLRYSKMGLFVRAASTEPTITSMQGVNVDRLSGLVVAVGTALAGLAGIIAAPFLSLSPSMSSDVIIDSFVVVVTGGLGSLLGAFAAALILGQVQAVGAVYLPEFATVLPYVLMMAVLLWRPAGFAGNRV